MLKRIIEKLNKVFDTERVNPAKHPMLLFLENNPRGQEPFIALGLLNEILMAEGIGSIAGKIDYENDKQRFVGFTEYRPMVSGFDNYTTKRCTPEEEDRFVIFHSHGMNKFYLAGLENEINERINRMNPKAYTTNINDAERFTSRQATNVLYSLRHDHGEFYWKFERIPNPNRIVDIPRRRTDGVSSNDDPSSIGYQRAGKEVPDMKPTVLR